MCRWRPRDRNVRSDAIDTEKYDETKPIEAGCRGLGRHVPVG